MKSTFRKLQIVLSVSVILALALSLMPASVLASPDTIIDLFDDSFGIFTQTGIGTLYALDDDGSILGGERDLALTVVSGGGGVSTDANISVGGALSHAAGPLVYASTEITYDGNDNDATTLAPTGLGGLDLTVTGDNMIYVIVSTDDFQADITVNVWTDSSNCSSLTRLLPGGIASTSLPRAYIFRYLEFSTDGGLGCTGPADFTNVGAIRFTINGTYTDNTDVVISVFAAGKIDYGDLPDTYGTTLTDDGIGNFTGAGHVLGSLYLGAAVDGEDDGQPSAAATNDDDTGIPDDEDGVVRINTPWTPGQANGGSVQVTTNGDGCFYGWIDWNNGGTFGNTATTTGVTGVADRIIATSISAGTTNISFPTPSNADFTSSSYNARFRLYPRDPGGGCWTGTGNYIKFPNQFQHFNGEIEDYLWSFGPLAVTLNSLQAQPSTSPVVPLALIGVSAAALIGVVFFIRRRRTA